MLIEHVDLKLDKEQADIRPQRETNKLIYRNLIDIKMEAAEEIFLTFIDLKTVNLFDVIFFPCGIKNK